MRRAGRLALTALLAAFSTAGPAGWPAAWLALAPGFYESLRSKTWPGALFSGLVHGLAFGLGYWHFVPFVGRFRGTPLELLLPVYTVVASTCALSLAAACLGERLSRRGGKPTAFSAVAGACAWMVAAWFWSNAFAGVTSSLAYSQWARLPLIQVADVAGLHAVELLLALAAYAVAAAFADRRNPAPGRPAVALLGLALLYGTARLSLPSEPPRPATIALLQGAYWPARNLDAETLKAQVSEAYLPLAADATGAALVVWPESSVPVLEGAKGEVRFPLGEEAARRTRAAQLFGASLPVPGRPGHTFNSAVVVGPDGRVSGVYHRRFPFPFGEIVPKPLRWLIRRPIAEPSEPGEGSPELELPFGRVVVSLCGESFQSTLAPDAVRRGAVAIVNLSNSLWTGDTGGTYLTYAISAFRAVENRVPFVRVDSMGPSMAWDAKGRVVSELPFGRRGVLRLELPGSGALTPYARYGDWLILLGAALAVGLPVYGRRA